MQVEPRKFYDPVEILKEVQDKVERSNEAGEAIDYLTFVPDGEPTLDVQLGREIELLKPLEIPIAVITNASLIGRGDVREELMKADWVSLKVDAVREEDWRRINRAHPALHLSSIQRGMLEFAEAYHGELVTETMLVKGVNDSDALVGEVADFLARLRPAHGYLSISTRPPAEQWVRPASEESINRAYQVLSSRVDHVEYLIGYEGNAFALTGNVEDDLLSITAVHPMRQEAVREFLARAKADWPVVERLILQGRLIETEYEERKFYMRRLRWKKA